MSIVLITAAVLLCSPVSNEKQDNVYPVASLHKMKRFNRSPLSRLVHTPQATAVGMMTVPVVPDKNPGYIVPAMLTGMNGKTTMIIPVQDFSWQLSAMASGISIRRVRLTYAHGIFHFKNCKK